VLGSYFSLCLEFDGSVVVEKRYRVCRERGKQRRSQAAEGAEFGVSQASSPFVSRYSLRFRGQEQNPFTYVEINGLCIPEAGGFKVLDGMLSSSFPPFYGS